MKRLHVHVSVDNLQKSIQFYSGMFGVEPSVVKPDYAKWMLGDPRVNFAISQRGAETGLDHLGIQVESDGELHEMEPRLRSLQSDVEREEQVACCYAKSDKYWVTDPSGITWEVFHTLDSIPAFDKPDRTKSTQPTCCAPLAKAGVRRTADSPCCTPSAPATQGTTCC